MQYTQEFISAVLEVFKEVKENTRTVWTSEGQTTLRIKAADFLVGEDLIKTSSNDERLHLITNRGESYSFEELSQYLEAELQDYLNELELLKKKNEIEAARIKREEEKHDLEVKVLNTTLSSNKREKYFRWLVVGSLLIQTASFFLPEGPFKTTEKEESKVERDIKPNLDLNEKNDSVLVKEDTIVNPRE
ncbi:hypothetical protein [Roseivirga sp.]|uniref:hypothetical protein n=1 Tax=Roseivirga sp. TaxID=1964215 RepID=UPI002B27015D|nr:hypothetical protein [Roseivirga sp.]